MNSTAPASLRVVLLVLFTVSGFSGLIYESIWSHYLKLLLGHAAYAQTLVLAIFMGGMALGAWLASRYSPKWRNPLLVYALAEGIIGLSALLFHALFTQALDALYLDLIPRLEQPAVIAAVKWGTASALILPQTILLGMTFPLMSAGIIRLYPQTTGATLGMLYFTNSIGAAAGVLISGFVLIEWVGLPGALLTAGMLNVLLAIAVWGIAKQHDAAPIRAERARGVGLSIFAASLLLAAFVSSAASFFYEIAWIRMLNLVLGTTNQAFELMLSAFIGGLALGGLWIRRRLDHIQAPLRYAGHVQVLMGLFALMTLPLYNSTFDFMGFMVHSLTKTEGGYVLFNLASHTLALIIMLPATFMAGMTLPLFTYALFKRGYGEASIGQIYASNTLGAILGVLVAVHVVMPAIGAKGLVSLGAFLDIALGVALLAVSWKTMRRWEFAASTSVAGVILLAVMLGVQFDPLRMASGVYRHGVSSQRQDTDILFHRDGKTATVDLIRNANGSLAITTNGKPDASVIPDDAKSTSDEITMVMAAALPLALHPRAKIVANIGLGSGMTTHSFMGVDTLDRVDTIEIEQAMVEAARGFGKFVERAYLDPRSHIHIEDAKTFFSSQPARYDIIVSEPSNPWVSGVASLFTDEFYRHVKTYLNDDGLLVQWLQIYEINTDLLSSVFKALSGHFSDYAVFNTGDSDILIIASNGGNVSRLDPWIFEQARLRRDMARVGIEQIQDLEVRRLGNKTMLAPLFASSPVPVNSDYFPYLSLHAPKSRFLQENAVEISGMHNAPIPVLEMLENRVRFDAPPTTGGPYFSPLLAELFARRAVNAFLSQQSPDFDGIREPLRYAVRLLDLELRSSCATGVTNDKSVRDNLFTLAVSTTPYLPVNELEPMWVFLASQPCYRELSAHTKRWFDLHYAAARRDSDAMIQISADLIENPSDLLEPKHLEYLFTASLTGFLSRGDQQGSQRFLERYAEIYSLLQNRPLYLRLLLSQIGTAVAPSAAAHVAMD